MENSHISEEGTFKLQDKAKSREELIHEGDDNLMTEAENAGNQESQSQTGEKWMDQESLDSL